MKFSDFQKLDKSIKLVFPKTWDNDIICPTGIDWPSEHKFFFVKTKKYFNRLLETVQSYKNKKTFSSMGIIFDIGLWDVLDHKEVIENNFGFVAVTENVDLSMSFLSKSFYDEKLKNLNEVKDGRDLKSTQIDESSQIASGVFVGDKCCVGKNSVIHSGCVLMAGSQIGDDCVIYPNTTIYSFVKIKNSIRIHAGCVIGGDGFGYNFSQGEHLKVWHFGGVVIEDNVELGAMVSIDAGTFSPTLIDQGTKLDTLVQIGHNCIIGKGVIMCGGSGAAGSTQVGDFTIVGGKTALTNDIKVEQECQIAGFSGVTSNLNRGSIVGGHPARPVKEWMRSIAYLRKLTKK